MNESKIMINVLTISLPVKEKKKYIQSIIPFPSEYLAEEEGTRLAKKALAKSYQQGWNDTWTGNLKFKTFKLEDITVKIYEDFKNEK